MFTTTSRAILNAAILREHKALAQALEKGAVGNRSLSQVVADLNALHGLIPVDELMALDAGKDARVKHLQAEAARIRPDKAAKSAE
jgi:hypothetical protein